MEAFNWLYIIVLIILWASKKKKKSSDLYEKNYNFF